VEFRNTQTRLSYKVEGKIDGKKEMDIWLPEEAGIHITSLEVGSGGGKSTFAHELVRYLAGEQQNLGLIFSFSNEDRQLINNRAVALIPQKPAFVLHWKISDILPSNSELIPIFFSGQSINVNRHMSSLSGGQAARIYACSALETLSQSRALLNYLILDEAFEGVNAAHANNILHGIVDYWRRNSPDRHLFILLISHLEPDQIFCGLSLRRLSLAPQEPRDVKENRIMTEIAIILAVVEPQGPKNV
jgi:ABC-type transport system involved in cytochrome bd biosynthesis fused ATPase/permease subunit